MQQGTGPAWRIWDRQPTGHGAPASGTGPQTASPELIVVDPDAERFLQNVQLTETVPTAFVSIHLTLSHFKVANKIENRTVTGSVSVSTWPGQRGIRGPRSVR